MHLLLSIKRVFSVWLNFCCLKLKLSWSKSSHLLALGFFKMSLLKGLKLEACSFTTVVHPDPSVLFLFPDLEKHLSKYHVFGKYTFFQYFLTWTVTSVNILASKAIY